MMKCCNKAKRHDEWEGSSALRALLAAATHYGKRGFYLDTWAAMSSEEGTQLWHPFLFRFHSPPSLLGLGAEKGSWCEKDSGRGSRENQRVGGGAMGGIECLGGGGCRGKRVNLKTHVGGIQGHT